jgi:hypothetical protein
LLAVFRSASLALSFLSLVAATVFLWNHRYESVNGSPVFDLKSRAGDLIQRTKGVGDAALVERVDLPLDGPVSALHLRFLHRAQNLQQGPEKWHVGRMIVDWSDAEGRLVAHDSAVTLVGTDEDFVESEMVIQSRQSGWIPSLRLEHQGHSGSFEIKGLQVMAVAERSGAFLWAASLSFSWLVWCFCWTSSWTAAGWVRRAQAASMMFAMGWCFVIPGPWAHPRPLGSRFAVGIAQPASQTLIIDAPENKTANSMEPMGKMPVQGSWLVKVKVLLFKLRPLLHFAMFAGPTFVLAVCCGRRCAWWTMILVALAVEASQAMFWFGSDWLDLADVAVDGLGIGMALWICRRIAVGRTRRFPVRWLQRMMFPASQSS